LYNEKWSYLNNSVNKIDILILGSSKGFSGINPRIIDSVSHWRCYNMCTPLQCPKESYYILKYGIEHFQLKTIILDVYWNIFAEKPDLINAYENWIHLPEMEKLKFSLSDGNYEFPAAVGFPVIKYSVGINFKNIIPNLFYSLNKPLHDTAQWKLGFFGDKKKLTKNMRLKGGTILILPPLEESMKYLRLIDSICASSRCQLIVLETPVPVSTLKKYKGLDVFHKKIMQNIRNGNFIFFDEPFPDSLFADYLHLNATGATVISSKIIPLIKNPKEICYSIR